MRTVADEIKLAQVDTALKPVHELTAYNDLISFAAFTSQTNTSVDTDVPQSYCVRAGGTYVYAVLRDKTGGAWAQVVNMGTAGDWALSAGVQVSSTLSTMRRGVFTDVSNNSWLYTAVASGSAIQVRRAQLSGTTNPLTVTLADFGPTFGAQLVAGATLVRRVEAVCPTDGGVIVAVGTHNFDTDLTTIQFYLVVSTAAVQLDALIQAPMLATYAGGWGGAWYGGGKWATHVCAGYVAATATIWVVASDHTQGRAVTFSVKGGACSSVRPIIPVDPEAASASFTPYSLTKAGSLYYLTGRYSQTFEDDTTQAFDLYLTSSDCEHWSFGERNSFLTTAALKGTFLFDSASSPKYYYYGGNMVAMRAQASYADGVTSRATTFTGDNGYVGWNVTQVANEADSASFTLANPNGTLDNHAALKRGCVMSLRTGYDVNGTPTYADFGRYGIDSVAGANTPGGREAVTVTARDWASRRIIQYNAPLDYDEWGCDKEVSDLSTLEGFVAKTPEDSVLQLDPDKPTDAKPEDYDVVIDSANHLNSKALNNPFIAYADTKDARDGIARATVWFADTGEDKHLSSFGFVFGGGDDNAFNALLIPKEGSWEAKTTPKVVTSRLAPYNETDNTGGFAFAKREVNLWDCHSTQEGSYNPATAEITGGAYATGAAFTHTKNTTRDYVFRAIGRRVQLFSRLHDYAPATCAANAGYTLHTEYLYSDTSSGKRYQPASENRFGLSVTTDVWGSKTAYESAYVGDMETQLTTATNNAALANFNVQAGTGTVAVGSTGYTINVGSWTSTAYSDQMHVGRYIRVFNAKHNKVVRVTGWSAPNVTVNEEVNVDNGQANATTVYYPLVSPVWGWCGSGSQRRNVQNSTTQVVIETGAKKKASIIKGRGIFLNDQNSAASLRLVGTDGVMHTLYSGSNYAGLSDGTGSTELAWDVVNPIPQDQPYGYSDPAIWRLLLHHAYLFDGSAATYGMNNDGFVLVDNEAIRYTYYSSPYRGVTSSTTGWTCGVSHYAPLAAASGPVTQLNNWTSGASQPGDVLGSIANAAGLLVEVSSRANESDGRAEPDSPHYYVEGSGLSGGVGYVTIAPAYPNNIAAPVLTEGSSQPGDVAIVSGRAQLATRKDGHASDAPVVYYPAPIGATSLHTSLVKVNRYGVWAGAYRCLEDSLRRLCALAGVRASETAFRNAFASPYTTASWSAALTTTPQALPLAANMGDFYLRLQAHLHATIYLQIDFRGYYRLTLRQTAAGKIEAGLQTTSADVDAGGQDTKRWLDLSPAIPINAGVDICPAAANNADIRIAAAGERIQVDVNGVQVWVFDLGLLVHSDGTSYRVLTPGAISLSYSSAVAGNTAYARVPELSNEHNRVTLPKGSSASSVINELCESHLVKSRATAAGGLEFGRFKVRDADAAYPNLTANTWRDEWEWTDTEAAGHYQTSSKAQAGATVDATWIAAEGYRFASNESDVELSSDGAGVTAQTALRALQEYSEQRGVTGVGFLQYQPEDQLGLIYAVEGTNDYPAHTETQHTITQAEIKAEEGNRLIGVYTLRKYVA